MINSKSGFATLTILMMLAFILLYTGIVWQSVRYLDELANAYQRESQTRCQLQAISSWAIALTKYRFDQIIAKLALTGHDLALSLEKQQLGQKLSITNAELIFSKGSDSSILLNGTMSMKPKGKRSFSCSIEKRATEKPDSPISFIVSGYVTKLAS